MAEMKKGPGLKPLIIDDFFAGLKALRFHRKARAKADPYGMTTKGASNYNGKSEQIQEQKQIPFGDDKQEMQLQLKLQMQGQLQLQLQLQLQRQRQRQKQIPTG